MSMMQRVLIASHDPPPEPLSVRNYNVFDGIVVNRYPVQRDNATECFSDLIEGSPDTLVVKHVSCIGCSECPS